MLTEIGIMAAILSLFINKASGSMTLHSDQLQQPQRVKRQKRFENIAATVETLYDI